MARPRKTTKPKAKPKRAARAAKKKPGAKRVTLVSQDAVTQMAALLAQLYPNAVVELDHTNPYQLLVATILAAQSTDKNINQITPALFAKYPDLTALAGAEPSELEAM